MPYNREQPSLATTVEALSRLSVYQLGQLATLIAIEPKPTKKDELVAALKRYLDGKKLTQLWTELDELQQAAVAEVVYSDSNCFPSERFEAKYGKQPDWTDSTISVSLYSYDRAPSKLCLFLGRSLSSTQET